ncbi:MAG: Ldh family oxidoreductase [Actinobacteria bacterium]|nr:Ldh family oxidoreductase [Actinomycetota bacterium]
MAAGAFIEELADWARAIFAAERVPAPDANIVAENLAYAERRGIRSHGFIRMPIYIERIRAGGIVADARPVVIGRQGAVAVVDCADGLGAVSAMFTTELAGQIAGDAGIALVAACNANHFGAAGFYAQELADRGLLGLVLSNSDAAMAPPGGGKPVLGTNPIAVGVPAVGELTPLLDMATTNVAFGKLIVAAQSNDPIPLDWAVDANGQPTSDANSGLSGALLPMGGPKGFGLAFMIDVFSALGGARVSPDVQPLYGDRSTPQKLGFTVVAVNPGLLAGAEPFRSRIERLVGAVHSAGREDAPAPMIPGEPEQRQEREANGRIWLSDEEVADLGVLAEAHGLPLPLTAS